jgi:prepilin-type N-terminal cleavage/methylation domain-containing protein
VELLLNKFVMREIVKKKDGFTLVEILLVIFIIAVLSTLAINGYMSYRRAALLDFTADSFVSQLYELRDRTIHGEYGGNEFELIKEAIENEGEYIPEDDEGKDAKCFGFLFEGDGDGGVEIKKFGVPYKGVKSIHQGDLVDAYWVFETCDYSGLDMEENYLPLGFDDDVHFVGIYDENDVALSDFRISFVPPDGEIEVSFEGSPDMEVVKLILKYGESDDDKYKRNIFINLESGKAQVTRVSDV